MPEQIQCYHRRRSRFLVDWLLDGLERGLDQQKRKLDRRERGLERQERWLDREEYSLDRQERALDRKSFELAFVRRWAGKIRIVLLRKLSGPGRSPMVVAWRESCSRRVDHRSG